MEIKHQDPLEGYDRRIGGSAGKGTHGGTEVSQPEGYPSRSDWDYEVSTPDELVKLIQEDNVIVGLDPDVDEFIINGYNEVTPGKNTTLVGHYCNPNVDGRGPVIRKTHYEKCFLKTRQPFHMYGVSLRGPMRGYFDPRERSKRKGLPEEAWYSSGVWVMTDKDEPTSSFAGCEFWGWTWAGAVLGAKNYETKARFERCSFHECLMETMGYGVTQFDGHAEFDLCFFDKCRHAVAGFGYPTETCRIKRCLAGPGEWAGHVFDRHELSDENPVAGKWIRISRTTMMNDISIGPNGEYRDECVKFRGIPEEASWIKKCHFSKKYKKPQNGGEDGDAYLQKRADGWKNLYVEDNIYGPEKVDGRGAPTQDKNDEKGDEPDGDDTPGQKLTIEGKGPSIKYCAIVDGEVTKGDRADKAESIGKTQDGNTAVKGRVSTAKDTFQLAEGAQLMQFRTHGPIDVKINGEKIDIGDLVAANMQKQIEGLRKKLDNAQIKF